MEINFDLKLAMECVRAFSDSMNIGCMLSSADGTVLYQRGYSCADCQICSCLQKPPDTCKQAHIYAMHSAQRFGGRYIYFCAMGLTCFTSPIIGPGETTAKMTVGPFLMVDVNDYVEYDLTIGLHLQQSEIQRMLPKLQSVPYLSAKRVTPLSELLFMAVGFMNQLSGNEGLLATRAAQVQQGQISTYIHQLKETTTVQPYPFGLEKSLLHDIRTGNREQAQKKINELLGHILFSSGGDLSYIRSRISELLVLISREVVFCGANQASVFNLTEEYRRSVSTIETIDQLCMRLSDALQSLMNEAFDVHPMRHMQAVHSTMQFIQLNYAKRITLDDIAAQACMSPTYISRVFKREVGQSIVAFLNAVRIEKSKELLAQKKWELAAIAQACGFEDQSYYTKVFKKATDQTPNQYRRMLLAEGKGTP